jgi:hypothetical protein
VIGKHDKIDELIVDLKTSGFKLKIENNLTDYLSCQLQKILILQAHLINYLEAKFGDDVKNKRVYKTPGTPRFKLFALKAMKTSLNRICRVDIVLKSECCCISSSILDLICEMLLGSCQNVWTRQQWGLTLKY